MAHQNYGTLEMPKRKLGTQGLEVSAIGLGCMSMSKMFNMPGPYGVPDEKESIATIHRALELGINFFDTAEMYGPFDNEILLGRALKGKRDQAVIATKFAMEILEDGTILGLNSRPENIRKVADASLKRLGVDYIDLFYQHRVDPNIPIEEVAGAMAELVKAGKVKYLGLSEASAATIRRAHKVHPISAIQTEYSMWERGPEEKILPALRELGIGFVPYSPLGRGFLTGNVKRADQYPMDDYRYQDPRFQPGNFEKNMEIFEQVKAMAETKNATPGQIALAWLLHQGDDIVPIPGTKHIKYLEENGGAATITLSEDEIDFLKNVSPLGQTAGPRYPEAFMWNIDRSE